MNINPSGHSSTLIRTLNSENCKLIRVVFTCKSSSALTITIFGGILCFSTVNSITSVLLGVERMVYIRLVQLTLTNCVYCNSGSLTLSVSRSVK